MTNNPLEISPFYSHLSMMPTLINAPAKIPSNMYRPNSWMDPTMQPFFYYNLGLNDPNHKRKNATRETTATLKAWLYEHRKNPYPTKNEKMVLAMVTKMTLTQVSTWFANARRRLKKENKLHRTATNSKSEEDEEEDDDDIDDDEDYGQANVVEDEETNENEKNERLNNLPNDQSLTDSHGKSSKRKRDETEEEEEANVSQPKASQRPKIWSLVDVVQSNETKRSNPSSLTSTTSSSSSSSSSSTSSSSLLLSTSLSSIAAPSRIIHPYMTPSVPYLVYSNNNGTTGVFPPNSTSSPSHSSEHSSNNSSLSPISSVSSTSCSPTK